MGFDWAQAFGVGPNAPVVGNFWDDPGVKRRERAFGQQAQAYEDQRQKVAETGKAALQTSQSYGQPYQTAVQDTYGQGGSLAGPGVGEQFFAANAGRFGEGGNAADVYAPSQGPGAAEQYWEGAAGALQRPTAMSGALQTAEKLRNPSTVEGFVDQNLAQFTQPTYSEAALRQAYADAAQTGERSREAYDQFVGRDAGVSEYYDQARQDAVNEINTMLAAQGLMGSTAGANLITDAVADLSAQEARDAAQYSLQEAEARGRLAQSADMATASGASTAAGVAEAADRAKLAKLLGGANAADLAANQELARMLGFSNIAGSSDDLDLRQLLAGGQLAGGAQEAEMARTGQDFAQALGLDQQDLATLIAGSNASQGAQSMEQGRELQGLQELFRAGETQAQRNDMYTQWLAQQDQALMDAVLASKMGRITARPTAAQNRQQLINEASETAGIVGSFFGMGSALGGGGVPSGGMNVSNPSSSAGYAPSQRATMQQQGQQWLNGGLF